MKIIQIIPAPKDSYLVSGPYPAYLRPGEFSCIVTKAAGLALIDDGENQEIVPFASDLEVVMGKYLFFTSKGEAEEDALGRNEAAAPPWKRKESL